MDCRKSLPSLVDCISTESRMELVNSPMVNEIIQPIDNLNKVQIVAPKAQNVLTSSIKNKCKVRIVTPDDVKIDKKTTLGIKEIIPVNNLNKVQIVAPKITQNLEPTGPIKIVNPNAKVDKETSVDNLNTVQKIGQNVAPTLIKIVTQNDAKVDKKTSVDNLNTVQIIAPKVAQTPTGQIIKIVTPNDAKVDKKTTSVDNLNTVQIIAPKIAQTPTGQMKIVTLNDAKDKSEIDMNKVKIVAPKASTNQKTIKIAIPVDSKTAAAASNSGAQIVNSVLSGGPYIVAIPPNSKPTKTPNPGLPVLLPLPPGVQQNGQIILPSNSSGLKMVPHSSGNPTLMSLGEKGQYFVAINPSTSDTSVNVPSLEKGSSTLTTASNNPKSSKPLAPKIINKPTISNKPILNKTPKLIPNKMQKTKKNVTQTVGFKLSNLKNKLLRSTNDKQLMNSYQSLERSYARTNKISKMRLDRLKKLKVHYKSTLNKVTDLCASIHFAAENVETLLPYNNAKRQGFYRYSFNDRLIAISLLRKSPSSYRILRPVFSLPSHKCLRFSLDRQNCRAGVNNFILNALKMYISKLDPLDRICCLAFDQMEIKVHTQFDTNLDKIFGLVDIGFQQGRSKLCGDNILVFELKSLTKKWSMPFAYFFTQGQIQSHTLKRVMLKIIGECESIGIEIISTSCPLYDNFVETLKLMGSDKDRPMFDFQDKVITTIYDPAHLLVLSRDELYKQNVSINICIDGESELLEASWSHIEQAYETDSKNAFPKLYKVKRTDLNPCSNNIKQAARCLSNSMASVINQQVVTGLYDKETLATAHYIGKLNETFDSFNGTSSKAKGARGLKSHLNINNEDQFLEFWQDTSRDIETWIFSTYSYVPEGWFTTLSGIIGLWSKLKEKGFTSLELKQFSNDSLRSMFKGMKSFYKTSRLNFVQFDEAFKNCANNYLINMLGGMEPYAFNNHKLFTIPLKGCSNKISRKLKPEKAFKKNNLQFSKKFLKCFSLCDVVKTIGSLLSDRIKCSKCLPALFDTTSGYKDEGFVFKSNIEDLYPCKYLIESISSCINDYEACMPKHMLKDRISYAVPEEMLKKFKNVWLKQACPTHFKTISKDIVHMTYEAMSLWWGRKLAKDHYQLILPEQTKKRSSNKTSSSKKKPKTSYFTDEGRLFVDESNIEETIISPSKYNALLNNIMPSF